MRRKVERVKVVASSDKTWGLIDLVTEYGAYIFSALLIAIAIVKVVEGLL